MLLTFFRLGRSSLDDARDALAEYLALLSRRSPNPDELPRKREESTVSPSRPPQETLHGDSSDGVDLKKSLNAVLQLYRRAVDILREKRERELLAAALCDLGALEVSNDGVFALYGGLDIFAQRAAPFLLP